MDVFLKQRLSLRLETEKNKEKVEAMEKKFQPKAWLAYASERIKVINISTHVQKFTNTSIKKTTDLFCPDGCGGNLIGLVGTHCVGNFSFYDLSTSNAANLDKDIAAFFNMEYRGRRVFDLITNKDEWFYKEIKGICSNADAFYEAVNPIFPKKTSFLAKQVYWLVGGDPCRDENYHLLAPLYATSLAHRVFLTINEDRFGEPAKEARKARRDNKPCDWGYQDYPNLAVQKMGGTKPQNISQLNSERGGNNYLLASLPPVWESPEVREPLRTDSVFPRFGRRREVRWLVNGLRRFLEEGPDPVLATRNRRDAYMDALIDELVLFASELHLLEPGWSAKTECRLHEAEALWLDLYRGENDKAFEAKRESEDWPADVRHRFANWLNRELHRRLPVGDAEHQYWMAYMKKKLDALQEVLPHV